MIKTCTNYPMLIRGNKQHVQRIRASCAIFTQEKVADPVHEMAQASLGSECRRLSPAATDAAKGPCMQGCGVNWIGKQANKQQKRRAKSVNKSLVFIVFFLCSSSFAANAGGPRIMYVKCAEWGWGGEENLASWSNINSHRTLLAGLLVLVVVIINLAYSLWKQVKLKCICECELFSSFSCLKVEESRAIPFAHSNVFLAFCIHLFRFFLLAFHRWCRILPPPSPKTKQHTDNWKKVNYNCTLDTEQHTNPETVITFSK